MTTAFIQMTCLADLCDEHFLGDKATLLKMKLNAGRNIR